MKNDTLSKKSIIFILIAIGMLFIGFIVMSTGDKTFSVILLVLAYIVVVPLALLLGNKKKDN